MLNDEFERNGSPGWSNWWTGFNWEEARAGVDRESRARILLVGLPLAGKSTLFNRLRGWEVSPPVSTRADNAWGVEDFGLFCLVDLPGGVEMDAPEGAVALAETADLLVYVLDGAAGVRAADYGWIGRLRRLGVPLVVVLNKSDVAAEMVGRLPEIEERLAASILPVSALKGSNVLSRLVPRMVDACPGLALALGRELRTFRRQAAGRLVQRAAIFNGMIALEPVPLLDIPLQMITLVGMVLRIAAVYDRPPTDTHRREVMAAIAGGLAGRYATQQALKLVPFFGWLASGLIGMSCTWLLGRAAVTYFEAGGDAALNTGWERARDRLRQSWSLLSQVRRPWPGLPQPVRRLRNRLGGKQE